MDTLTLSRLTGITKVEIGLTEIALRLLIALILGITIAITYRKTHKAFAFSYSMVVAIILISTTVSMVLMVIDNSLSRAFGLVGALAIIRFRTPVKDIRDIVFLFLAVANGIACGAGAFTIAAAGVLGGNIIGLTLYSFRFGGSQRTSNLLVKLMVDQELIEKEGDMFENLLEKYCDSFSLIELQAGGSVAQEIIYSIRLSEDGHVQPLVTELNSLSGVNSVVVLSSIHNMDVQ